MKIWNSISSAPKDETPIMIKFGEKFVGVCSWCSKNNGWKLLASNVIKNVCILNECDDYEWVAIDWNLR